MNVYTAEFVGTTLLVLLGDGVVANVLLARTKGHGGGWIVITAGWAFAVFVAVGCVGQTSGAHLNPAVSIGLAAAEKFDWALVPGYIAAQLAGAFAGACFVFVCYRRHFDDTEDPDLKLAVFCTAPNIRSLPRNFVCEVMATFVLVLAVLSATEPSIELAGLNQSFSRVTVGMGSLGAVHVGLVVFAIGLSLGGTTGYAINPARDVAPRFAHAILPIRGKRDSDWSYAAIPILGPIVGALVAVFVA
jgi:glycerol uptake facilitator protein